MSQLPRKKEDSKLVRRQRLEATRQNWEPLASCRDIDTEIFYPSSYDVTKPQIQEIKNICNYCPVAMQCLEYNMTLEKDDSYGYRWGIVGGLTPHERNRLQREMDGLDPDEIEVEAALEGEDEFIDILDTVYYEDGDES